MTKLRVSALCLAMTSVLSLAGCAADAEETKPESSTHEPAENASQADNVPESDAVRLLPQETEVVTPLTGPPTGIGRGGK